MKKCQQNPMYNPLPSLTPRQLEVWRYLLHCISIQGICPSYREIAQHLKIHSPYGVRTHLDALERKGYLKRKPNRSRAITLLKKKTTRKCEEIPQLGTIRGNKIILETESDWSRLSTSNLYPSYVSFYVEEPPSFCPHVQKGYSLLLQTSCRIEENQMSVWLNPKKELALGIYFYHPTLGCYTIQQIGNGELCTDWKEWMFLGIMKGWVIPVE